MDNLPDLKKDEEDFIKLSASNSLPDGSVEANNCSGMPSEDDNQRIDCEVKEGQVTGEILVIDKSKHADIILAANSENDLTLTVEVNDSTVIKNKISVLADNGSAVQDGIHKRNGSSSSNREIDAVSGIKRPRITVDEQQASVHVVYNSISRESKQKLEEFLQKWSEWHVRHNSLSHGSKVELESGEGTYFPALNIGLDKPSAMSFWMDGQTSNLQSKEVIALDNNSIPLYDRGYSFGLSDGLSNVDGGLEMVDGSRCFNCGSYNHALKECIKPRNNAAVNSARKQHKAKRNQNSISRNPTRYYQDTPGGKFDGLTPGVLDPETRKLLGLAELDPPPWLNRMREIGYPPGYLDAEDEDQPSGIEIFGEVVVKQETEDGEILDMDISPPHGGVEPPKLEPPKPDPPRKMSVEFPGVNAPIPENADEWRWGARAWKFDLPRSRSSNHRSHHSTEHPATSRQHYPEERWNRDYRDDGPPGVDPVSGSLPSSFSPRYPGYDSRGSSYGRHSLLVRETSSSHDDDRWNSYSSDSLSHRNERNEDRHHRSWR